MNLAIVVGQTRDGSNRSGWCCISPPVNHPYVRFIGVYTEHRARDALRCLYQAKQLLLHKLFAPMFWGAFCANTIMDA